MPRLIPEWCASPVPPDPLVPGVLAQALAHIHEALALAQEPSHPPTRAFTHCLQPALASAGGTSGSQEQAEAADALATEHGFPSW